MSANETLYSGPADHIDFDVVRQFVIDAENAHLFTESLTFEAKERMHHNNVVEAVAALSNTDGGIVLVGVRDRGATGADRIVGVPQAEHDQLVSQFRNVIPAAMPEVIPVRIPATQNIVIVLRIDADAVLHPVIVGGKVLYRVPGQKVPADRQRVLDLIARDDAAARAGHPATTSAGRMSVPTYAWQPAHIPLWNEEHEPGGQRAVGGELRVVGGLTLPYRIVDRPWLNTRAKDAALDALNSSPLRSPHWMWQLPGYEIHEGRATTLTVRTVRSDIGPAVVDSAAHLNLANRKLSVLLALRWHSVDDVYDRLPLDRFYWALVASLATVASTYRNVARALDAAEPSEIRPWEAWLRSSTQRAFDVIDIDQFERDNRDKPEGANFPSARTSTTDRADLDQLARNWLTYWLLEVGTRNFEGWLADRDIPNWLWVAAD